MVSLLLPRPRTTLRDCLGPGVPPRDEISRAADRRSLPVAPTRRDNPEALAVGDEGIGALVVGEPADDGVVQERALRKDRRAAARRDAGRAARRAAPTPAGRFGTGRHRTP